MPGTGKIAFEMAPFPKLVMMSIAASAPFPDWIRSYHFFPCGSARIFGSPPKRSGKNPKPSEWSVTAMKSRGRESFTRWPLEAVTSCPFANR